MTGIPSDCEETRWTGGVNHDPETENSDFSWEEETESPYDEEGVTDDDEHHWEVQNKVTAHAILMAESAKVSWKKAESKRALGYTGNSARTVRRQNKQARDKEKEDVKLRKT